MDDLKKEMRARASDARLHLSMLRFIEDKQALLVAHNAADRLHIDTRLFQTMKANVFLHLYNLVESTINACLRRAGEQIRDDGLSYNTISESWKKAWVKTMIKGDQPLNPDNRLAHVLALCEHIINGHTIDFQPQNNSGNLDDKIIEDVAEEYGVQLVIRREVQGSIKRHVLNEKGMLQVVRERRNELAHGLVSFAECGKDWTTSDLEGWIDATQQYLEDVISSFESHLLQRCHAHQP